MSPVLGQIEKGKASRNMPSLVKSSAINIDRSARAMELFDQMREGLYRRTDRMFAGLIIFEWIAGIIAALLISPKAWAGADSSIHIHVWAAIFIGGANTLLSVAMVVLMPGKAATRHVIAGWQ